MTVLCSTRPPLLSAFSPGVDKREESDAMSEVLIVRNFVEPRRPSVTFDANRFVRDG